jgi:hypothetical protein
MILKKVFRLPLFSRTVNEKHPLMKEMCVCVGGTGKFFKYNDPLELDPFNVNRFEGGVIKSTFCFVEADSVLEAIGIFHEEWDGAKIGGPKRKAKALWINEEKPILEYPFCKKMEKTPKGRYVCGRVMRDHPEEGEFGGCILDDYASGESCPIEKFLRLYGENKTLTGKVFYRGVSYAFAAPCQTTLQAFAK